MKSLADWLMVIFMLMYWGFRVAVCFMATRGTDFVAQPIDLKIEIPMLFITFFCIVLIAKRNRVAAAIYIIMYFAYFGINVFNNIMDMVKSYSFSINGLADIFFSIIGLVLAIVCLIDFVADHLKQPVQKNTDWFYENKDYDRKLDSRADKNNYRIM